MSVILRILTGWFWPALLMLSMAGNAVADVALTPYTAEYKVKISILSGKLLTEFRRTDAGYMAKSVIEPQGLASIFVHGTIEESAWFDTITGSVVPERYHSVDTITEDRKVMDFEFDWGHHEITGKIDDQDYTIPLDGPVHDRVSIQYELMYDLLNKGPSEHYVLLNDEELRPIVVTNIGRKKVKVPFGEFEAVGIQHHTEDSSRVSTLWCVEELGYIPVIIEQHRDGKLRVRAVLKHYTPIIETAAAPAR